MQRTILTILILSLAACGYQARRPYDDDGTVQERERRSGYAERDDDDESERGEPKGGGNDVDLAGTGWIIYRDGQRTGQNMLFCASGRWEVVFPDSIGPSGTWRQSGGTLTTRSSGTDQDWQIRAVSADEVELDDGSGPITLRERGPTTC